MVPMSLLVFQYVLHISVYVAGVILLGQCGSEVVGVDTAQENKLLLFWGFLACATRLKKRTWPHWYRYELLE
jgi:hypothetical protein